LASIDIVQFSTIRGLREKIVLSIKEYLEENAAARLKFAGAGEEFYFMKSVSFVLPNGYQAIDLKEFSAALRKITIDSIYFHIFEARLRLERGENDFSLWMEDSLEDKDLAREICKLDPYTQTMEDLRSALIRIVEKRIAA
jgi:hypothetical protein